ncbi:MAG: 5-formyltetrahydrofolate cyclo-ligase [Firmicutes bacterium]|nr:5-formyltetrahydrofolate cyclo-ligase [Bacillota bacterium]
MNKYELRKIMIEKRRRMSKSEWESKSQLIHQKFLLSHEFAAAKNIMLYADCNNEVATLTLISKCIDCAKQVLLPVVRENHTMLAAHVTSSNFENDYIKNRYGIFEPKAIISQPASEIDMIVAPMVAADKSMHRLGYGGGYYDRFIENSNAYIAGFCFDFQIFDFIPHDPHDKKMNKIITDKQIISGK